MVQYTTPWAPPLYDKSTQTRRATTNQDPPQTTQVPSTTKGQLSLDVYRLVIPGFAFSAGCAVRLRIAPVTLVVVPSPAKALVDHL